MHLVFAPQTTTRDPYDFDSHWRYILGTASDVSFFTREHTSCPVLLNYARCGLCAVVPGFGSGHWSLRNSIHTP
jgi:hypothetical protein